VLFQRIDSKGIQREIIDYLGIWAGVTLTALGLVWFLIPNKIAAGGVSGLAVVFYYSWGWPVAVTMLCFNVPLFLACLWVFGPRYGAKTLFGAGFISIMVDFWERVVRLVPLTRDPLLAALYGGVLAGIGMGLAFRFRGTTGGTDLAAQLINKYTGMSIGHALMVMDGIVIVLAGIVFGSTELALYAIMTIVITSKSIDMILEGLNYAKAAIIISERSDEIASKILKDLRRGATGLLGRGLYSGKDKQVILCVIARAEMIRLKELVKQIDPAAFVIITDAYEVLGEGFQE